MTILGRLMDDRRDLTNVLLSGLLGLRTAGDTAWHAQSREMTHLQCLGLPSHFEEDEPAMSPTDQLHFAERIRQAQQMLDAEPQQTRGRRKRHLRLVTNDDSVPSAPQDVLPAS